MAVELTDHIPSLVREVNPPGDPRFTGVDNDDWLGYLTDAFWEARLDGFMSGFTCDEYGVIEHETDPNKEFPRYLVGLIVLYAGIRVLRNSILNTSQSFSATAGPVQYSTQNSATVLAELLKMLQERRKELLEEVQNAPTPTYYFDAYTHRQHSVGAYWGEMTEYLVGLAN